MEPLNIDELTNIPVIDLDKVYLRAVELDDYPDMYDYGKNDEVTKTLMWNSYQHIEDAKNACLNVFLARPKRGMPSAHAIIDKITKKMIGTCDFAYIDWANSSGEIGYVIHPDYWGQGIMTSVCAKVVEFGFQYLGLKTIVIGHYLNNIGSKRVILKNGFTYTHTKEAKNGHEPIPMYKIGRNDIIVRRATIDDSVGKGTCHYQSWIETYTGLIEQEYLDNRSVEKCIALAYQFPMNTFVATKAGKVLGFSAYNTSRDEDLNNYGEIRAIYVLKKYYGHGIGTTLMDACYHALSDYENIMIYVLKTNTQAIAFYKHLGFTFDGKEKMVKASSNTTLHEVRMININPVYKKHESI